MSVFDDDPLVSWFLAWTATGLSVLGFAYAHRDHKPIDPFPLRKSGAVTALRNIPQYAEAQAFDITYDAVAGTRTLSFRLPSSKVEGVLERECTTTVSPEMKISTYGTPMPFPSKILSIDPIAICVSAGD